MIRNFLASVGLTIFFTVGVLGGLWLDRLPASLVLTTPVWKPTIRLPYVSLKVQRDQALDGQRVAEDSVKSCRGTLAMQSTAASRAASLGAIAIADAERQLRENQGEVRDLRHRSVVLRSYRPQGTDACTRWVDVDAAVVAQLRGGTP